MKTIILTLIATALITLNLNAQEIPAEVNSLKVTPEMAIKADSVKQNAISDTTIFRDGEKDAEKDDRNHDFEFCWGNDHNKKGKSKKFDGHWEGIEFGFNGFDKPNYSQYNGNEFMSLNQGKSIGFNFNFYELNISLIKNYFGFVSGMGVSFNNYRFENPYTLAKGNNMTEAVLLSYDNLSKTKLAVSYLNVPLLFELQIPVNDHEGRLFVNAGLVGGVKIGSHTKVKHGDVKDKVRSGFNMNSFKYDAALRVGYKDVSLFATYSFTPLFQTGKGPELTPFTIGISFLD